MNENASPDKQTNRPTFREQLRSAPPAERPSLLAEQLRHDIAILLGITPDQIPLDAPFDQLNAEWADPGHTFDTLQAPIQTLMERSFRMPEFMRWPFDVGPIQSIRELAQHLADEFEIPAPQAPYTDVFQGGHWAWGPLPQHRSDGPQNRSAVFVIGVPRVGSTLLRIMLDRHPALYCGPELLLLPFESMGRRAKNLADLNYPWMSSGIAQTLADLERLELERAWQCLGQWVEDDVPIQDIYRLFQDRLGQRTLVDKSPLYVAHRAWLWRAEDLFENPTYIHLTRHPCATIESFVRIRMHWVLGNHFGVWDENPWLYAEKIWAQGNRNALDFGASIEPRRHHRVRYEDLVTHPEAVMRQLCDFLGIPFDDAVLHPYQGTIQTYGPRDPNLLAHSQIDPSLATAWTKNAPPQELSPYTQEIAAELGYDVP